MIQHDGQGGGYCFLKSGRTLDSGDGGDGTARARIERSRLITILNQRWALLVLQSLIAGPKRFNEISKATGVNPNTLRERLRDFEELGIVRRTVYSETPPNVEYGLTARADELAGILDRLFEWAGENIGKAVVRMTGAQPAISPE